MTLHLKEINVYSMTMSVPTSHLTTQSSHHTVKSPHSQITTQSTHHPATQSTHHTVNSPHSQLTTQSTHPTVNSPPSHTVNSPHSQLTTQSTHHPVNSPYSQLTTQPHSHTTHYSFLGLSRTLNDLCLQRHVLIMTDIRTDDKNRWVFVVQLVKKTGISVYKSTLYCIDVSDCT